MTTSSELFRTLERINERPAPYSAYTAGALWTSPDISEMMLRYHLDGEVDLASRKTAFIASSVEWIRSTFELGPGRSVIDFGCGPGLYTNRLSKTGAAVTGIDFSERSVDYARAEAQREGLAVDYVVADYLGYETDQRYDLAMMIMCDYCALSPEQRARFIGRVRHLLKPGGAFLFDVYSLSYFETWEERSAYGPGLMDGFWSASEYYGFLNTFTYQTEKLVLEKYVIVEAERTTEYFNWFQHFDPAELATELEAGGLTVETVFSDVAGLTYDPGSAEFAVTARSPSS
ncbi:MAG: class I SAM-dependent methyltransferase [Chloroflexota bacterium]